MCERKQMAVREDVLTPKGKTSPVWKYFGYFKGEDETNTKPMCKLCGGRVERAGGTSNLKAHLRTWHRTIYDELYPEVQTLPTSSKQGTMDCYVKRVEKLSSNCERAKKLTKSICEMIARDIRPISIVDDVGFLNVMKEAEPRYVVPCRSTISRYIDDMYVQEKRVARSMLADVDYLCCTSDMWTSRSADGYISLTCHFINKDFKMCYKNLQTHHFPGSHDHTNISEALSSSAVEWCIDLHKQVVAFTTDSGSNIVKALEEMGILRLPCAGHTLNLAVQKGMKVQRVVTAIGRCRKLVAHFHRSRVDSEDLQKKQEMFQDVKKNKLIMVSVLHTFISVLKHFHTFMKYINMIYLQS